MKAALSIAQALDTLEAHYGPQTVTWPVDPYLFIVWWHCGYPAADAACARGWEALTAAIGTGAAQILATPPKELAAALKAGGMVPELRALRLKEIAARVENEFAGDLRNALSALPQPRAAAALKKFPNIAGPGADRILLFAGIAPVAAIPSNNPHVPIRILRGPERLNYGANYREAQEALENGLPAEYGALTRAYLLLKRHGQEMCKRTAPKCAPCPLQENCAFALRRR